MYSRVLKVVVLVLVFCAAWQLASAAKIYAKAWLAQVLMEDAWQQTLAGEKQVVPWPWADTWPVARLSVPRLDVNQIVLAGDSGRVLAFGPGYNEAGSEPGTEGVTLISGHRDTSFVFMQHIKPGDAIQLQSAKGEFNYRVVETAVVDQRHFRPDVSTAGHYLMLVTCYPFEALELGGDARFVVLAEPVFLGG